MKLLTLFFLAWICWPTTAAGQFLHEFRWKSRLLLVFTPAPDDPLFVRQMQLIGEAREAFAERDVRIILLSPGGKRENTGLFLDQEASALYYDYFAVRPYQLEVILVGLDSTEKLRTQNRITAPSIFLAAIDRMPMRQRELLRGTSNRSAISKSAID